MIDSVCKNRDLLTSVEVLSQWLTFAVSYIGMQVIGGPYIVEYPGNGSPGITGVVVLAESHIAVHTYPE